MREVLPVLISNIWTNGFCQVYVYNEDLLAEKSFIAKDAKHSKQHQFSQMLLSYHKFYLLLTFFIGFICTRLAVHLRSTHFKIMILLQAWWQINLSLIPTETLAHKRIHWDAESSSSSEKRSGWAFSSIISASKKTYREEDLHNPEQFRGYLKAVNEQIPNKHMKAHQRNKP